MTVDKADQTSSAVFPLDFALVAELRLLALLRGQGLLRDQFLELYGLFPACWLCCSGLCGPGPVQALCWTLALSWPFAALGPEQASLSTGFGLELAHCCARP